MSDQRYDARRYWGALHAEGNALQVVGYPNLPSSFNRAMYRAMARAAVREVRRAAPDGLEGKTVLDVGAGTGVWTELWRSLGARVTALELSEIAAARLRERLPDVDVVTGDVADPRVPVTGSFDLVTVMSVLLHVTDDEAFERAVTTIGRSLRPGGAAIIVDPIVVHRWWGPPFDAESNSKARPLAQWEEALGRADLELRSLAPVTDLLASAVDARHPAVFRGQWLYWNALSRAIEGRERAGAIAGAVLSPIDRALVALKVGLSTKCLVAVRASSTAGTERRHGVEPELDHGDQR